jgi:hypothetical protein
VPSFGEVAARVEEAAQRLKGHLTHAGEVDGYPVLWLEIPALAPHAPRIWVSAGIHGEEPGSVEGCLRFLAKSAKRWRALFSFTVLPCLSPYGYERGQRFDARGRDPNRLFRHPEEPLVAAVRRALEGGPRPLFAFDLHEDSDFSAFYMYEIAGQGRPFAPDILAAVGRLGPIAHGRDLEPPIEHGLVVFPREEGEEVRDLRQRDTWPIAFLLWEAAEHTVTLETPVLQPLTLRAAMHVAAMEAVLARLKAET